MDDKSPILNIERRTDSEEFYVKGWEELERWGLCNSTHWRHVRQLANMHGLSETDQLKMLVYAFLIRGDNLFNTLLRAEIAPVYVRP